MEGIAGRPTPSVAEIASKASALAFGNPVIQNGFRGILAEVIIGAALDGEWRWCSGDWGGWDFEHPDETQLEVKQSAALQTWALPKKRSPPRFDIRPRTGYFVGAEWRPKIGRHAHIYVFVYHPIADTDVVDHRNPEQWQFHVVRANRLPANKTIGLTKVAALSRAIPWNGLCSAVETLRAARVA
jgi:hypothetical protein